MKKTKLEIFKEKYIKLIQSMSAEQILINIGACTVVEVVEDINLHCKCNKCPFAVIESSEIFCNSDTEFNDWLNS